MLRKQPFAFYMAILCKVFLYVSAFGQPNSALQRYNIFFDNHSII